MKDSCRTYYIYKITRSDGKLYIGTTDSVCIKNRMCRHKKSSRFIGYDFSYEIIEFSNSVELIDKESYYIQYYNTLTPNGLNISIDGKGNHLSSNFTTRGFKFSEESKKKMSESSKSRTRTTGWKHSDDTKKMWSDKRTGKCWKKPVLTEHQWNELNDIWNKKPACPLVNSINKKLSYERSFAKVYAEHFGLTVNGLYNIITNKLRVFKFPGEYPLSNSNPERVSEV